MLALQVSGEERVNGAGSSERIKLRESKGESNAQESGVVLRKVFASVAYSPQPHGTRGFIELHSLHSSSS